MAASSNIPAVNAKNFALTNDVAIDVKKLEIEDAEIAKGLAAFPNRPDAGLLNARRGAIATIKKNHE
ncbi:MAG TPA: hypothetical protein VN843_30095 [Anaerolineales bacterium]|nr:hypothetical protein [Anaerolineales bacterium]